MLEFIRLVTEVPRSERKVETRTTYCTFIMGVIAGFDGVSGMVEVYQFRPHMAVSCYSWYTGICVGLYLAAAIAGVVGTAVMERRMPWKTCARVCCGSAAYLGITAAVYGWFRRQIRTPQEPIVYNTISDTITVWYLPKKRIRCLANCAPVIVPGHFYVKNMTKKCYPQKRQKRKRATY